jgi:hypothetical protein
MGAVLLEDKLGDIWLLDDTSLPGSFGERRIKLKLRLEKSKGIKFYKLRKSLSNWAEMLSNLRRNPSKTYVDNTGRVFRYTPKTYCPLTYHKIVKIQIIEGFKAYLTLEGINCKLEIQRPPPEECTHVGILSSGTGYLIYNYATGQLPKSIRKI